MVVLSFLEEEGRSHVHIEEPAVTGLVCDLWCYEDKLGNAVSFHGGGEKLELIHSFESAETKTEFYSQNDGVELRVTVTGPDKLCVQTIDRLNPCWQMRRSESFGNRGHYVEDFVSRCFVILDGGLTFLKDTSRIPGTRKRPDDPANYPEPWIQEYFPVWRNHPGQIDGRRGHSLDRPVYPIIGCVSRDGNHMAAFAWPETESLGQVWHDCLHPRPAIGESYDEKTNTIISLGRLYFIPNDEKLLLDSFRRDYPGWVKPA